MILLYNIENEIDESGASRLNGQQRTIFQIIYFEKITILLIVKKLIIILCVVKDLIIMYRTIQ
jgi:hypothetical protein